MVQELEAVDFKYDDGGRSKYFKGSTGDCVVRAIAIAAKLDYKEVYDELFKRNKKFIDKGRCRVAKAIRKRGTTPRNGNFKKVYDAYIKELGFKWVSTMGIGTGMTVHVNREELPNDATLILRLSKHLACYDYGVLRDTYDCSREGTRGVYGYYIKE